MKKVIHPTSIGIYVKTVSLALLITVALFGISNLLSEFLFHLIAVVWVIALIGCLYGTLMNLFKTIEIDENALIIRTGILNRRTALISYRTITDVHIHQSFFDRLVGIGALEINTAGTTNVEGKMRDIRYNDLKEILETLKTKEGEMKHERAELQVYNRKKP